MLLRTATLFLTTCISAYLSVGIFLFPRTTFAQQTPSPAKPNILVIFGDDIGIADVSAYSGGLMGFETPNIDRIGREGIRLQHYYGEQSCTAGRSAFLTGQHIIRTGLSNTTAHL